MATQRIEIKDTDGWIQVAESTDKQLLVENGTMVPARICFYSSAGDPPLDHPSHRLFGYEKLYRELVEGKVYIKHDDEWPIDSYVTISKRSGT